MNRFFLHAIHILLLFVLTYPYRAWAVPTPQGSASAGEVAQNLIVPKPDLSSMQKTVRERIEQLQSNVEGMRQRETVTRSEISEAFGLLGQAYHAFELLDAAATCYSNALTLTPDEFRWLYYRGLVLNARGELEAAVADYQKVASLQSDALPVQIRLGNALLDLGVPDAARRHFNRVIEAEPNNAAALYGLGRVALETNDLPKAIEQLESALRFQPAAKVVHYSLAQAHRKQGDLDQARVHLAQQGEGEVKFSDQLAFNLSMIKMSTAFDVVREMAKETGPFSETDFLGFVLAQFGEVPGMSSQFEHVITELEQDPASTATERGRMQYALGALLVSDNDDASAIEHFRLAVELAPELVDARIKLGNALARQERFEEAARSYDQALTRDGDNRQALVQRAAVRGNLGRLGDARSDLERLLRLDPQDRQARLRLASLLEREGELDAAAKQLAETLPLGETAQDKADSLVALADLYQRHEDFRSAADLYQRALGLDPEHRPALYQLAALLGRLGHYQETADVFTRLIELDPNSAPPRVGEATALILAKQHEKARQRLEEGLTILPDSLDLKDILARHLAAAPEASIRDGQRALELAREIYEVVQSSESIETLAMAYAQANEFEQAVEWQKKLLASVDETTAADVRQRWDANLKLYQQQKKCCAGSS